MQLWPLKGGDGPTFSQRWRTITPSFIFHPHPYLFFPSFRCSTLWAPVYLLYMCFVPCFFCFGALKKQFTLITLSRNSGQLVRVSINKRWKYSNIYIYIYTICTKICVRLFFFYFRLKKKFVRRERKKILRF